MMKRMKEVASVIFVTALFSTLLLACNGTSGSGSGDGEVWRIGGIGPTSGPAALFGQSVENGALVAVEEINAAGGINGFPIEFNFQDDQHNAEISVNAYNALMDWGMQILLGTVTSTPAIAVSQEAYRDNLFMLTPSATAIAAIGVPNAFRVCFSDPDQGRASADFMSKEMPTYNVGILYDSSCAFSSGIFETFYAEAEARGLNIVSVEAFTEASNTDFSVQLQLASDASVDVLFLPIYYQEASLIFHQAREIGFAPVFFGVDGMDGILGVEGFDTSLAEGVKFLAPFAPTAEDEATQNFVKAYAEMHAGAVPLQFAANAYDGMFIIKAAIEHAGLTPDMSVEEIGNALMQAMLEITVNGVTLQDATWGPDGEPDKEPMVIQIRGGQYWVIYPY